MERNFMSVLFVPLSAGKRNQKVFHYPSFKMITIVINLFVFLFIFNTRITAAATAGRYSLPLTEAPKINLDRDYYSVSVVKGWISTDDSFFESIFSKKSKLLIAIEREISFFDGKDGISLASLYENPDISRFTDRPWGQNINLLDKVPGDANTKVSFKLTLNRDDRISDIINALDTTEISSLNIYSAAWIGYSKIAANIIKKIFGTDTTTYPFYWLGDIKLQDVVVGNEMYSHYIVLITQKDDRDYIFGNLNAEKLQYDEKSQQLKYEGQVINDRSYVVLKVSKSGGFDIRQLTFESAEPWSVLASSNFRVIRTDDVRNADQLTGIVANLYTQLSNEEQLLKRERRFTKYDRAKALVGFAVNARDRIKEKCKQLKINDWQCPSDILSQYANYAVEAFALHDEQKNNLSFDSKKLSQQLSRRQE